MLLPSSHCSFALRSSTSLPQSGSVIVASTVTAIAMPTPSSFTSSMSALAKPTITATNSSAARVMIVAVRSRPMVTLVCVSWLLS